MRFLFLYTDETGCPVESGMEFALLKSKKDARKDISQGGKNEN